MPAMRGTSGHMNTQIIKILKLENNNTICVYPRKSACPACPVGPEDRTGVGSANRTGVSYLT
jgi:hypothetical protein